MEHKENILRFRAVNRDVFLAIKNGTKKIETRAVTKKYRSIQKGDILVFVCGKSRFKKQIRSVEHFSSIRSLVKKYRSSTINPIAHSEVELRKIYYTYPNYREKIKKEGIIAWTLE